MLIIRPVVLVLLPVLGLTFPSCAEKQEEVKPLSYWLEQAKSEVAEDRYVAMEMLSNYPDQSDKIFMPLIHGLLDVDTVVRAAAEASVLRIGQPLADKADELLDSNTKQEIAAGCEMIHHLGPIAVKSVPKLLKLLASEDPVYNNMAIFAARNLESRDPELKKFAIHFLDDENFQNQIHALKILQAYGSEAKDAAVKLKELATTGNTSVRGYALMALGAIGPVEEFDVAKLIGEHLDAFAFVERERALNGLGRLGPAAQPLLGKVESLMHDSNQRLQVQAALARWKITGDAGPSVVVLRKLLDSVDLEEEAVLALGEIGPDASAALDQLLAKLRSEDESYRLSILGVIERIGPNSACLQVLKRLADNDPDTLVRKRANDIIQRSNQ